MYHTTGFRKDQILDLCVRIHAENHEGTLPVWPPILGLFKSVVVALTYLRRNRVQAEIGETFNVSQPTISRAVTALTEVLGRVVADYVPVAEDLDPRTQYIVDGSALEPFVADDVTREGQDPDGRGRFQDGHVVCLFPGVGPICNECGP